MFRLYLSTICYPLNPKIQAACGVTEDKILRIWEIQISFEKTSQSEELTSNTMWAILRQTLRPILEKHKMWNTNCEIQNWKIQNEKYKFWNTEWEIQIEKYKLWHRKIEIWTDISSDTVFVLWLTLMFLSYILTTYDIMPKGIIDRSIDRYICFCLIN